MPDILTLGALAVLVVSLLVGVVVGVTGMGGGALLTPALIFLGVPPAVAVSNDLVASAVSRSVGAVVHWRGGGADMRLVRYLVLGSVPAALVGALSLRWFPAGPDVWLRTVIGGALLLAAMTYLLRMVLAMRRGARSGDQPSGTAFHPLRTIVIGVVGGLLVGLTSVGSGSVMMVALLVLYPALSARRLVGTDLVQAIPLVVAAAVGHVIVTGVDASVLVPLTLGSTVGTYLGSRVAGRVPAGLIRRGIVLVLALTGLGLVGVPPVWVGVIGAVLVILGPAAWALLRHRVNG